MFIIPCKGMVVGILPFLQMNISLYYTILYHSLHKLFSSAGIVQLYNLYDLNLYKCKKKLYFWQQWKINNLRDYSHGTYQDDTYTLFLMLRSMFDIESYGSFLHTPPILPSMWNSCGSRRLYGHLNRLLLCSYCLDSRLLPLPQLNHSPIIISNIWVQHIL